MAATWTSQTSLLLGVKLVDTFLFLVARNGSAAVPIRGDVGGALGIRAALQRTSSTANSWVHGKGKHVRRDQEVLVLHKVDHENVTDLQGYGAHPLPA